MAFHPDGTRLATDCDDTVRIWDTATGQHRPPSPATPAGCRRWRSPRTARLAGQRRRRRHGADLGRRHRRAARRPQRPHGQCAGGGVRPGRHLAGHRGGDGTVRIWDTATGEHAPPSPAHTGWVQCGGVRPGRHLAGQPRRRHGADLGRGHRRAACHPHRPQRARCGGGDRPGRHPAGASGGDDGTVRIWDPATGEHRTTLTGHSSRGAAVALSPDGTRLARRRRPMARCGSGTPPPASSAPP